MGNSNRHHDAARAGVEEEAAREQQCRQDEQMNQLRNAMDQERRDRAEGRREEREKQEAEEKRSNEKMEEELGLLMEQERKYNKEKHKEQMREIEKKMLEGMKKVMEDLEDREKIRNEHMKTMHEPFMKDKQMNQIEAETTVKFEQFKLAEKIAEKEISKLSAADAKRLQEYHANVMSKSTRRNYKPRDTFIAVRNIRSELHHLEHLLEDLKSGTTDIKKSSIKECDLSCQRILAVLENRESFQNSDDFDLWSRQKTLQKMKEINAELQVLLNKFDLLSDDDHSKSHIVRFAAENIEGILSKTKELGFLLHRSWVSICANLQREKQMDILIAPASSHTSNRLPLADLVKEIKKANAELSQNLKSASNLLFPEGISDCKVLRQNSQKTLGTLENCVIQALDQTEAHSSKDLLRLLSSVLSLQVLIEGADEFLVDGLDEKQMELAGEVVDMIRNEQKKLNDAVEKVEKLISFLLYWWDPMGNLLSRLVTGIDPIEEARNVREGKLAEAVKGVREGALRLQLSMSLNEILISCLQDSNKTLEGARSLFSVKQPEIEASINNLLHFHLDSIFESLESDHSQVTEYEYLVGNLRTLLIRLKRHIDEVRYFLPKDLSFSERLKVANIVQDIDDLSVWIFDTVNYWPTVSQTDYVMEYLFRKLRARSRGAIVPDGPEIDAVPVLPNNEE